MSDEQLQDVGPCCVCGGTERVRNIVMLSKRAPEPGTGWGCFVCGQPRDGAIAVICDACADPDKEPSLKFACRGFVSKRERIPIEALTEPFDHDLSKHPEVSHSDVF